MKKGLWRDRKKRLPRKLILIYSKNFRGKALKRQLNASHSLHQLQKKVQQSISAVEKVMIETHQRTALVAQYQESAFLRGNRQESQKASVRSKTSFPEDSNTL